MKMARRTRPQETGTLVGVRLQADALTEVDGWIARQPDPKPSRPEAIRQLLAQRLAQARTTKSLKVQDLTSQNDT